MLTIYYDNQKAVVASFSADRKYLYKLIEIDANGKKDFRIIHKIDAVKPDRSDWIAKMREVVNS